MIDTDDYAELVPLFLAGHWSALPPDVADLMATAARLHSGFQRRAKARGVPSGVGPVTALFLAHTLGRLLAQGPAVPERDRRGTS